MSDPIVSRAHRALGPQRAAARFAAAATALFLVPGLAMAQAKAPVTVVTSRAPERVETLLRVFEGLAGARIELRGLSGDTTPQLRAATGRADVFIAEDAGDLADAKAAGLTAPAKGGFESAVPASLKDPEGHWFALSQRLRVIVAARGRVAEPPTTYLALADARWKGKLCMASAAHPSNVALLASIVARTSSTAAESWLKGIKANLALKPLPTDTDQILAAHAGKCDIALVDTSAIGTLRAASGKSDWQIAGNGVTPTFPDATGGGAARSISGMALLKDAPNAALALRLMDFLMSEPAQFVYAQDNHEYPARDGVAPSGLVESWGKPKIDTTPAEAIQKHRGSAVELIGKVGAGAAP